MQNVTCVELRIDANAVDEASFAQLMQTFDALGGSEETEAATGNVTRVAWFEVSDNSAEQNLRLSTAAELLGANKDQYRIEVLSDDWETAWQKNWSAITVGKSMCVRPSFCEPLPGCDIDIVLDPGMAFGTGTHPTTFLCLESIEDYCLHQKPQSVLDMGAGSGLLAIAAGKMGAQDIHAIDYDPLSVDATNTNADMNQVILASTLGDTPPLRTFELVVANILAGPLLQMAAPLANCVANHLILSGLLEKQAASIIEAYESKGLKHLRTRLKEEWAAVEFVREK